MGKILNVGRQEINIKHFTTDITNFPFIMDSNCFIAFSLLWRKYIACSANENLITDEGWFQYPLKSLAIHCGFGDIGTLRRAVEGLYRSGVVDVRVEDGSRLWATWKMNKKLIERLASLSDRDAMDEPYLKSIESIESKDREFTYTLNKEGTDELKEFFGVRNKAEKPPNSVENPPLLNTIIQEHYTTIKQQYDSTIPQYHDKTTTQQYNSTIAQQNHTDVVEGNRDSLEKNSLKEDFDLVTEEVKENQNEPKSEIEGNDDSNRYQPIENKQLTPSENKEISKAFRTLEFCKPPIDTNTLKDCLDLLHEVSQSNRETYKDCLAKAHSRFKQLLEGYTKEERKPITKALLDLSSTLGEAFKNKEPRQK